MIRSAVQPWSRAPRVGMSRPPYGHCERSEAIRGHGFPRHWITALALRTRNDGAFGTEQVRCRAPVAAATTRGRGRRRTRASGGDGLRGRLAGLGAVGVGQGAGDLAGGEAVVADLPHRRHLGGGAGQEHLARLGEFRRLDGALDHLDAVVPGEADHRPPGDAVEEAIRCRRVDRTVSDQEHVGTRALGDEASVIEHQGV